MQYDGKLDNGMNPMESKHEQLLQQSEHWQQSKVTNFSLRVLLALETRNLANLPFKLSLLQYLSIALIHTMYME